MMWLRSLPGAMGGLMVLGALLLPVVAHAGAAEDYDEGYKQYSAGDVVGSMATLRRAADAGHAEAQALLGDILDKAEEDEEAVAYYRKSAAQGNAHGQYGLGSMYATGEGVEANAKEAQKWVRKSAEQGFKLAVIMLAQSYAKGGLGLTDEERAAPEGMAWLKKAADMEFLPSMEALLTVYREGGFGQAPDAQAADQLADKIRKMIVQKGKKGRKGAPEAKK